MEALEVGGARLECRRWPGREPGLVLLHEGLGCVSMWRDFPERLQAATGNAVFAWSRRGYGGSSPAPAPWPVGYMHDEARHWLPQVLQATGFDEVVLVGHSDGASIAAIYAGDQPENDDARTGLSLVPAKAGTQRGSEDDSGSPLSRGRAGGGRRPDHCPLLRGLVLMAPHFFVEDISVASIAEARVAYETGELKSRLERHHGANVDGAFQGWNRIWLDPAFRGWDIQAALPYIQVPTLVIQGAGDEYGTLAQVEAAQAGIAAPVTTAVLPACRHAPHRDQPDATLAAISAFLSTL